MLPFCANTAHAQCSKEEIKSLVRKFGANTAHAQCSKEEIKSLVRKFGANTAHFAKTCLTKNRCVWAVSAEIVRLCDLIYPQELIPWAVFAENHLPSDRMGGIC